MAKGLRECIHTDGRGRNSLRLAPECSQASMGIIVSIVWEEVFTTLTPEQLDIIYGGTWAGGLIRPSDIETGKSYDILYKTLLRVGYAQTEARQLGTQTIASMRGKLNDG